MITTETYYVLKHNTTDKYLRIIYNGGRTRFSDFHVAHRFTWEQILRDMYLYPNTTAFKVTVTTVTVEVP